MGGATNCAETPRQKMIGMMYIVLTALLAMNVSASILEGFTMVEHSLHTNIESGEKKNENTYGKFEDLNGQNPVKVGPWLAKAKEVQKRSNELFEKIQDLKIKIVQQADGGKADIDLKTKTIHSIEARDNLDAAGYVCLPPNKGGLGEGPKIKKAIDDYVAFLSTLVSKDFATTIKKTFNTEPIVGHGSDKKVPWEEGTFEMMPIAAVVTILTKIQNDIVSMEGEVITDLKSAVDADELRVNKIEAMIIPRSENVIQGGKYEAQIILAASDSTKNPEVYVGGSQVPNGKFERSAGSIGEQKYAGFIKVLIAGKPKEFKFEGKYFVSAPAAIISADKMNVFYAGIDNDVSVSVPGIPSSSIKASFTNATVRKTNSGWVVIPNKAGVEVVVTVTANVQGKDQKMGSKAFRVKPLPPPVPFIPYRDKDNNFQKHKNGKIPKSSLLTIDHLEAELNDADIEAKFVVTQFELNITEAMGTTVEASNRDKFTERQLKYLKGLAKGKKVFISGVKAIGPDKREQSLPPMEIIIN